jgi:beta-phosphoglucomutase
LSWKAVLFDFDGTLAATMEFNFLCWRDTFREFGYELDKHRYFLQEGKGTKNIAELFLAEVEDRHVTWRDVQKRKNELFLAGYELHVYPEIKQILSFLSRLKVPSVIVTGSDRQRLLGILDDAFKQRFAGIVCADDTTRHKPYADPYLRGAEMAGIPPHECLVVENAPAGVSAGKAAGAFTVALETTLSAADLAEADRIFSSHRDFFAWLRGAYE